MWLRPGWRRATRDTGIRVCLFRNNNNTGIVFGNLTKPQWQPVDDPWCHLLGIDGSVNGHLDHRCINVGTDMEILRVKKEVNPCGKDTFSRWAVQERDLSRSEHKPVSPYGYCSVTPPTATVTAECHCSDDKCRF